MRANPYDLTRWSYRSDIITSDWLHPRCDHFGPFITMWEPHRRELLRLVQCKRCGASWMWGRR